MLPLSEDLPHDFGTNMCLVKMFFHDDRAYGEGNMHYSMWAHDKMNNLYEVLSCFEPKIFTWQSWGATVRLFYEKFGGGTMGLFGLHVLENGFDGK